MKGPLPALAVALLLLAPTALAHLQGARPILQRGQVERIVDLQPGGLAAKIDLHQTGDPLRQWVSHFVYPATGLFSVEHRPDASEEDRRFFSEWRIERLVEYRDMNVDGLFQPALDTPIKAWRLTNYDWQFSAFQDVLVEDVKARSFVWEANLTSAPQIRVEVVIAGKDFTDEGSVVRPQDVAIYFDFLGLPPRGLGSLYALETSLTVQPDTSLSFHRVDNTSTALLADGHLRRGLVVWGGEALVDGHEERLGATLEEERIKDDGNKTARLVLHLPTADESIRFVIVSGLEYGIDAKRGPMPALALLLVGVAALAMLRRRR